MKGYAQLFSLFFTGMLLSVSLSSFADNKYKYDLYREYKDYKGELIKPVHCPKHVLKDGIYVGLGLGYDGYRIRQTIGVPDSDGFTDTANPMLSGPGIMGNIFAGYGRYFSKFYIAGEIFTNFSGASSGFSVNDYNSNFIVRNSFGFSIIPGVAVNDLALFYGRIGYTRTYFRLQENDVPLFSEASSYWGNAANLGLGMEIALPLDSPYNFSIRGEYNYITYQTFKSNLFTSYSVADNQYILSALYHFDFL